MNTEDRAYKEQWKELIDAPIQPKADSMGPLRWKSTSRAIKPGHFFQMPIHVDQPGSEILFEFHTEANDIEFEVSFTPHGENGQLLEDEELVMLEKYRINAHEEAVRNSLIVENPGVVVLTWDNAYSWLTGKVLSYSVKLILPKETSEDIGQQEFFSRKLQECATKASGMKQEYRELQGTSSQLGMEISGLESQLLEMQELLQTKNKKLDSFRTRSESVHLELKTQQQNVNGLFVRSLTDAQAAYFISFFFTEDVVCWSMASKQWNVRLRTCSNSRAITASSTSLSGAAMVEQPQNVAQPSSILTADSTSSTIVVEQPQDVAQSPSSRPETIVTQQPEVVEPRLSQPDKSDPQEAPQVENVKTATPTNIDNVPDSHVENESSQEVVSSQAAEEMVIEPELAEKSPISTAEIEIPASAEFQPPLVKSDTGSEPSNIDSSETSTTPKEESSGGGTEENDGTSTQDMPPFNRKPAVNHILKQGSVIGRDYRAELTDFYEKNNPSKLDEVGAILKHFKGNEERMLQLVKEKYGGDSQAPKD